MPDPIRDLHLDDSIDINLRPVDEVIRRAIVLVTLARRGSIESSESEEGNDEDLYAACMRMKCRFCEPRQVRCHQTYSTTARRR
jgi:hypothetical protein